MARRFAFPDPDDRSKNNPREMLNSDQVLGLYNQDNPDEDAMQKVTKKVKDWICEQSKIQGWDDVHFIGNQCILTNEFKK